MILLGVSLSLSSGHQSHTKRHLLCPIPTPYYSQGEVAIRSGVSKSLLAADRFKVFIRKQGLASHAPHPDRNTFFR
jgi:hypothetical protein